MLFKKTSKIALSIAILGIMSANAVAQQSVSIERNPLDQTPVSLTFSGSEAVATSQVPQLFAKYLGSNAMIGKNMTVQSVTTTPAGITTTRYAQYYQGIKVAYGGYTVVSKSGVISYMAGNYYNPSTLLNALPALTTAEAFTKALASVNATLYMWQDPTAEAHLKQITGNADTSYLPKGELVWIENFNEQNHDRTLHLAYSFDVYAQKPISRNNIYVDAQTG